MPEASGIARTWAVVVDVSDLDRGVAFWGGLLGVPEISRRDPYAYLGELAPGVKLVLQRTADAKAHKNRVHLELTSRDPEAAVAWVLDHGGSYVGEPSSEDYSLTVLTDPDGNELCVSTTKSGESTRVLP